MSETRFPPDGVMCVDCGCCQAKVYAGEDALCWACDAGNHPAGKLAQKTAPVEIPAIRLEPVRKVEVEVKEERPVNVQEKKPYRTPDEIRAKIAAEPESESNCAVARKYGVSEPTARKIRLAAGVHSTASRGGHGGAHKATPKPERAIERKHTTGHSAALATVGSHKISITVEIDEQSADAYWHGLSLEQKAATIELQMQAIVDCRVAARA